MHKPSIDEILPPKPQARPRIYAYTIAVPAHHGLLKVGQTTRRVKQRVAGQLKTAAIENYTIELDEAAERDDGSLFTDFDVRTALVKKKFLNTTLASHIKKPSTSEGFLLRTIIGPCFSNGGLKHGLV